MFHQIIDRLADQVKKTEGRTRARSAVTDQHLQSGIRYLVAQLWKGTRIHSDYEGRINKRSGWYSENNRYRNNEITYRQTIAAYDGLIKTGYIRETRAGYIDRNSGEGQITKFEATQKLKDKFTQLTQNPLKVIQPKLDAEVIVLRDQINGKRKLVDYSDTAHTISMRNDLQLINKCISRHWADIRISDDDLIGLQRRLLLAPDKEPIDLTSWSLVRIFSNGSFNQGGRFYRGWWQNVPSEYRKYITIDGKVTAEFDFSQLNLHIAYIHAGKDIGDTDAYDRVLDGEHRGIVKEAFNAMLQASSDLNTKPKNIDLTGTGLDWATLRSAVLKAHKPIEDLFFRGMGNHFQYLDSCIAERVMLHFAKLDYPVLPIHDSFIMQQSFADTGELEEEMLRSFHDQFKKDIKVKKDVGIWKRSSFTGRDIETLSFNELVDGEPEYSGWNERNS